MNRYDNLTADELAIAMVRSSRLFETVITRQISHQARRKIISAHIADLQEMADAWCIDGSCHATSERLRGFI